MEQLNGTFLIEFEAFLKGDGANAVPFQLRLSSPRYDENRGYFCRIECPYIRSIPFNIYGVDEIHAFEQSIGFVSKWLRDDDMELVDRMGETVDIPRPPNFPEYANDRL